MTTFNAPLLRNRILKKGVGVSVGLLAEKRVRSDVVGAALNQKQSEPSFRASNPEIVEAAEKSA